MRQKPTRLVHRLRPEDRALIDRSLFNQIVRVGVPGNPRLEPGTLVTVDGLALVTWRRARLRVRAARPRGHAVCRRGGGAGMTVAACAASRPDPRPGAWSCRTTRAHDAPGGGAGC